MKRKHRLITVLTCMVVVAALVLVLAPAAFAAPAQVPVLVVDTPNHEVASTTLVHKLVIKPGGGIVAPEGKAVSLTVNGVEMGGVLADPPDGIGTVLSKPGLYINALLTITDEHLFAYKAMGPPGAPPQYTYFPFREALYLDANGVVKSKSVLAAAIGPDIVGTSIKNVNITSKGENFNGIFVADGAWNIKNAKIRLTGNGRSDFAGYGAGIVVNGEDTKVVIDHASIINQGVVRAGVVADGGSNVIVKHSYIETKNGVLPEGYIPTIDTTLMRSVPWMLSLSGNVRATNLLGTNTKASYINSTIRSEGWGVLSTDGCTTPTLTAINSKIEITGKDGYGSYGIGNATEYFYGSTFNVATYATISRGSFLFFGDSTPAKVAELNTSLGLGLTKAERLAIPNRPTVVNSKRFGIMWHGGGTLDISGGTVFNTKEAVFLDKGQAIQITVDGSQGARLDPANGVLMQVMDDDDPGPVPPKMTNTGVYSDPIGAAAPDATHDVYVADNTDALATFKDIKLAGDFYNSTRGGIVQGPFGPPSSASKNLGLTFEDSTIKGVITASTAVHHVSPIDATLYRELGRVINTPAPAINNGVLVALVGRSAWMVGGTCYLTSLTVGAEAAVTAPAGHHVVMTVGGVATPIVPGHAPYTGAIVLTVVAD